MSCYLAALIAISIVIIDQWSKYYVETTLSVGTSIPIIPRIFHITYVLNPGAAFGILENQTIFFIIIAVVMLAGAIYFYRQIPPGHQLLRSGISLMSGGSVGNVIDRVKTGHVVDFFDFRIWPVFNIADIAIVTGVAAIIFAMLVTSKETPADNATHPDQS